MIELKADLFCLFVTIVDNWLILDYPTLQENPRTECMLQNFIRNQSKATKETVKETKERPLTVNPPGYQGEHEFSIEDVDEDKITEILRDATKNLVVFFYDGRVKCPGCGDALSEVEEIDDDIEATGYIE
uniref:Uncharacterized protein n=1 Tax=Acrobeloides nanus TaxID=290746 RepID=A0A914EKZ8_9BILA